MADPQEIDNLVRSLQTQPEADPGPSIYAAAMSAGPAIAHQLGLFFNKGLSGNLEDAGVQMPAWSKAVGDVLHGDTANTALGVFAGPMAKTANLAALERAREMAERRSHPRSILDATGWWQGPEGKWRFEIPDTKSTINTRLDPLPHYTDTKGVDLAEYLNHPELYQAYPELQRMPMMRQYAPGASYHTGENPKIVTGDTPVTTRQGDLLHEVQHAIQEKEGFAPGGNASVQRALAYGLLHKKGLVPDHASPLYDFINFGKLPAGLDAGKVWDTAYNIYRRYAGEVEARNVTDRFLHPDWGQYPPYLTADRSKNSQIVPQTNVMELLKALLPSAFKVNR